MTKDDINLYNEENNIPYVTDKTNAHYGAGGYLTYKGANAPVQVAGTLSRDKWLSGGYNTSLGELYFDAYTSATAEEYIVDGSDVIAGLTGVDLSEEQDGSIMFYMVPTSSGTVGYVLSHGKITFPENCSYLFVPKSTQTMSTLDVFRVKPMLDVSEPEVVVSSYTKISFNNIDTSNVINMSYMFDTCTKFTSLDLSNFDTTNCTNMR